LVEITGTTNEGNTFVIAQALVPSESAESIVWVFKQVSEIIIKLTNSLA